MIELIIAVCVGVGAVLFAGLCWRASEILSELRRQGAAREAEAARIICALGKIARALGRAAGDAESHDQ